jgi:hypothetical protein
MKYSNKMNAQLIAVCIKLHNFCIRMNQKDNVIDDDDDDKTQQSAERSTRSVVARGLAGGGNCSLLAMGVDPNNLDSDGSIICPPSGHFSTAITIEDLEEDTGIHNSVAASSFSTLVSDSTRRQTIVQNLASRGLERPAANKIRNKQQANA